MMSNSTTQLWREVGTKLSKWPFIKRPTPENRAQLPDQVALYEGLDRRGRSAGQNDRAR